MRRRRAAVDLFPVNVWPPFIDAVVLALAAFVLLTIVALAAHQALQTRVREGDRELQSLRADKERIERRLRALAPSGTIEIEEGKVILQGEVLFDSGSDALRPDGRTFLERIGPKLETLLEASPDRWCWWADTPTIARCAATPPSRRTGSCRRRARWP